MKLEGKELPPMMTGRRYLSRGLVHYSFVFGTLRWLSNFRFIIQYAHMKDAVIISNDNFKDIYEEEPEWRDTITYR